MEEISGELILNWDQTGLNIVPSSSWTMDKHGAKRVEITGAKDKRQITTVFCGTLVGDFLPIQLIFKGKTSRCHPHFKLPSWWHVTHSPNHWSAEETMLQYIEHIIIPYVQSVRNLKGDESLPALVIIDNFKGQVTDSVKDLLEENNVHIAFVPPHTTDLLQPLDVSVNKPAKCFLRQKFDDWYASEIFEQLDNIDDGEMEPVDMCLPVMKELFSKWIVEMYKYIASNPQFIVNGFIHMGITKALDGDLDSASEDDVDEHSTQSTSEDSRVCKSH